MVVDRGEREKDNEELYNRFKILHKINTSSNYCVHAKAFGYPLQRWPVDFLGTDLVSVVLYPLEEKACWLFCADERHAIGHRLGRDPNK